MHINLDLNSMFRENDLKGVLITIDYKFRLAGNPKFQILLINKRVIKSLHLKVKKKKTINF